VLGSTRGVVSLTRVSEWKLGHVSPKAYVERVKEVIEGSEG